MAHEFVFGLIGPKCASNARKTWNELLQHRRIDGFFDFYRTETSHDLVTRFSEMFLLERRGYLIAGRLQADAVKLMDVLTQEAKREMKVDVVKNERGVLIGHFMGDSTPQEILDFWMKE
jgi:shikimate 5-dehydrogenase